MGWCQRSAASGNNNGGSKCGRWNPTAEQVKVLTDLFRSGLRTPSTDQIQKISCQLSSMGKIESKNVFYWFQNHKARERHHTSKKRRRHGLNILSYNNNSIVGSESETAVAVSARTLGRVVS